MQVLGTMLILLGGLAFALALGDVGGVSGEGAVEVALLAAALTVSGAVFSSAAALARRLDGALLPRPAPAEEAVPAEAAGGRQPAGPPVRRPGFHRRAA